MDMKKKKTDPKEFAAVANEIFAPAYPVIAQNIVDETGVTTGVCLDLGAGTGWLGCSMARLCPGMEVILYDPQQAMVDLAGEKAAEFGGRVTTLLGSAEKLPLADGSVSLAISRGSVFFWEDQIGAMNEIYRVLQPGGHAYIGGGFGNRELFESIREKMVARYPEWDEVRAQRVGLQANEHFSEVMKQTSVPEYTITGEDPEMWIHFRK